jgi:hypothetical protein
VTAEWHSVIAAESELPQDAARQLHELGFAVLPGPVIPGGAARLAEAYDRAVSTADPADVSIRSSTRVHDFVNRGPEFDGLYLYGPLLAACRPRPAGSPAVVGRQRRRARPSGSPSTRRRPYTAPSVRPVRRATSGADRPRTNSSSRRAAGRHQRLRPGAGRSALAGSAHRGVNVQLVMSSVAVWPPVPPVKPA